MVRDEEKDLYIKSKIKDGKIPPKINNLFENSIKIFEEEGEKNMEENIENNKQPPKKNRKVLKIIISIAACALIALGGGNIYATTKGYDNVFFMIKEWIAPSTEVNGKDKILSDKDITISYQPIQITDNIGILISKMQVKGNNAKIVLLVKRNDVEKDDGLPLKYKIYNSKKNLLCDQISKEDSNSKNTIFEDELIIENYSAQDTVLDLEIYKTNGELITTIYINLEDKEINIVGVGEYLEKISEIELKEFVEKITELPKAGKKYNNVHCIDIPKISYNNGNYTVTYTYFFSGSDSLFEIEDISRIDIYQNTIVIKLKENNEKQEFEIVSVGEPIVIQKAEIAEGNLNSLLYGDVNCDGIVNNDDADYLVRHLANWPGYELTEQGWVNADVNIDGRVNNKDHLILSRHLANWEGYEVLPYVEETTLYGDANCDGIVNNDDVECLMKHILGVSELTEQGRINADVNNDGKLDGSDCILILRQISPSEGETTLYGDANCDGIVNNDDVECLMKHILGVSELTEQGRINADVNKDGQLDSADCILILRQISPSEGETTLYGDVNCDGIVNNDDVECLMQHILGVTELTEQGRINADVNIDGKLDAADCILILRQISPSEGETILYGDVNCDGIVNNDDHEYLTRHLANWEGYELTEQGKLNADVNADGEVTSKDRAILARHLANWPGYETLPRK